MKNRVLAFILAAVMLLCLSGCGAITPAKNMKKTIDAVLALDSFELSADASASFTADGTPMSVTAEAGGSVVLRPLGAGLEAEVDMGRLGTLASPVYFRDGQLYFCSELNGEKTWYGTVLGQVDIPSALDGKASLAAGVVLAEYLTLTGTETVDGAECSVYHFLLDEATLKLILAMTDEMTEDEKAETVRWLSGTNGDIWIDNASFLPVKLTADCSNAGVLAISELLTYMGGEIQTSDMKLTVTLEFDDFNDAAAIEYPAQ